MSELIGLNLNVDQKYIADTARKVMEAGILSALGDKEELMNDVIKSILSQKVDVDGKVSRYSSDNKYTILDLYVRKAVIETAKEVMSEIVDENRTQFKKMIKKQLSDENSLESFVKSFIDNTVSSLDDTWRSRVEIKFENQRGDD